MSIAKVLALAAAIYAVGYHFGWLVGGSMSPIAGKVAPLVFGLLATLGVGAAVVKSDRALLVALAILLFFGAYRPGLRNGVEVRHWRYQPIGYVLYEGVDRITPELAVEIYRARWMMREAGVDQTEHDEYMHDVILPMLLAETTAEERLARIRAAVDQLEFLRTTQ